MVRSSLAVALGLTFMVGTATRASALIARSIPPLESTPDVALQEVLIGDPIAIDSNTATPLFNNDRARRSAFWSALEGALRQRLAEKGLSVRSESRVTLGASLYGGTFADETCPGKVFFSLEVWVHEAGEADSTGGVTTGSKGLLGVVDDCDLERSLIETVLGVVDSFLGERTRTDDARR